MNNPPSKKVLLIGWDAADWKVIDPLIEQGKMPALKSLIERGVYGKLQTLDPPLSPMLWTSIATGFRADKHGIGGFIEPNPDGTGLRPITSTSRKVKAIWNILHHEGKKSNVVGWWPSNPAEPINGVMISNLYQVANAKIEEEWVMSKGTVHPNSMIEEMKEWRVHPGEITLAMTIPFIPNLLNDLDLRKEKRTAGVVKVIANAASIHAASTHLMENTEWDFMAVYHDAIDHFSHLTMKFHPPYRPEIDLKDYENYKGVVEAGYRFHDMMLERTLELIDDDTTVIIISDHGFHSDHQRPLSIPLEPSGPAIEHSPYGVMVMSGPGIKKGGERISGASVLDITPTLLALFGLPVGKDMEGRVIQAVFEKNEAPKYIESWEDITGDFGMHPPDLQEDPWEAIQALQQLVELGYIDEIGDDKLLAVEKAKRENQYYVARNLINGGKIEKAIEILETIFSESKILRYGQRLAYAYLMVNKLIKCQELIDELREEEKKAFLARKKEILEKNPEDPFGNQEMEEPMYLEFVEGLLNLQINKPKKALPILERVQKKNPNNMQVAVNIGKIHNAHKNYQAAEKQFIKALAIDDRNPRAHHGLGIAFLRSNRIEPAIDEFLLAIEENFFMPNVHYHLGEAFFKAGYFQQAVEAFEVAVRLSPGMTKAHKWLVEIYSKNVLNEVAKNEHELFLKENIKGELNLITGLTGSGFEEVLEALVENGIAAVQNKKADNLLDKYIISKTKKLHLDSLWLKDYGNQILYVHPQFLSFLPPNYNYKLIVIKRDLNEVIEVEQKMMGKKIKKETIALSHFQKNEKNQFKIDNWIESQPTIDILISDYTEYKNNPNEQIDQMINFIQQ
jgi:predicted AlkP superfamily phosphohydrolase/phosphomutase/tetratricopeptide (TPR) repeat protein